MLKQDDIPPSPSHFEFWPNWLFYMPMRLYVIYLIIRHRSIALPTIANPLFDIGGLHGESKMQIQTQIPKGALEKFAYTIAVTKRNAEPAEETLHRGIALIKEQGWQFPIVVKPDIGLRGMGVQRIFSSDELLNYIKQFPDGATMVFQDLYDFPNEAGLFYIRKPDEEKGRIFSLTLKHFSHVTGDGVTPLKQLIEEHPRYGRIAHIFLPRHRQRWDMVLAKDEKFRIVFAGSHSRGTVFTDGAKFITPEMEATWDKLAKQIPEFYFGRFDIRFHDMEDLEKLENLRIIEVNGAGAEATHIWDSHMTLREAYSTLMKQYRLVYEISVANQQRGFKPMKLLDLLKRMRMAGTLSRQYPHTH